MTAIPSKFDKTEIAPLTAAKHVQTTADRKKAEQVAKQFEAVLVATMVREMRQGTELFGSSDPSAKMFDTMFDEALATQMGSTGNGFGIRKMVLDALDRTQHKFEPTKDFKPGVKQWDPMIEKIATEEGVDPNLVRAVMERESGGHQTARSRAGACGLMQLMPDTARSLGVKQIFDPEQNLRGGVKYLKEQIDRFGRVDLALAAYNAGPNAVERHRGIPPFSETRSYVSSIMNRLQSTLLPTREEDAND